MSTQKFNISKQYIAEKIFVPEPPKQGEVWTNLNVTVLPDYLAYIKLNLTKQEQLFLSQYHLQTYLLETALKPHPKNDFDTCTTDIISHIRQRPEFWVRKKGSEQQSLKMHEAISQYHKDCQFIEESKMASNAPEAEYRIPVFKKIQNDYVYIKNQYQKAAHRFSANLYPWVAEYLLSAIQKEGKQQIRAFMMNFMVMLAIKSRPKIKFGYQLNKTDDQKNRNQLVEQQITTFTEYLQKNSVDYKSLSSIKDYYLIANSLIICKKMIESYTEFKPSEDKMDSQGDRMHITDDSAQEILSDLANRFIIDQQLNTIIRWLSEIQFSRSLNLLNIRQLEQKSSKEKWRGLQDDVQNIQRVFDSFSQIVNHPENTNRMKYKLDGLEVPWTDQQYHKFLESFLQFFNVPTNNKKIALAMGKGIQPNHVKHVKGLYMRNMSIRIENGEIGGGRKGLFESKTQFLKKDIQNFNVKWFKKQIKTKTRRIKKRRKRQTYDGEQHDSDY